MTAEKKENHLYFEDALDKAGFGCYSYLMTGLGGMVIIAFSCVVYNTTIIVPASACELETTTAQQGLLAAIPFIGAIIGTLSWGYIADRYGRRSSLLLSLFLGVIFNALISISVNWIMMMMLQFVAALMVSGQYPVVMTLLSESVPMAKRNLFVLLVNSLSLLAQGLMALIAIPIIPLEFSYYMPTLGIYWNSWRTTLVVYSAPSLLSFVWLYFLQESPKFVFAKGNDQAAIEILRKIHATNNMKEKFQIDRIIHPPTDENHTPSKKDQILPLFKPPYVKNLLLIVSLLVLELVGPFMVWLPTIANQFMNILETGQGHDLNLCGIINLALTTPSTSPNRCSLNVVSLLLVLLVGGLQCLTNIIVSVVVKKFGPRNLLIAIIPVTGVSGILVNLVPNAIASAILFLLYLMGFIILGLVTAVAVSMFPTQLRAMAVAIAFAGGRASTFASLQILNYLLENSCEVGFYVYSGVFALSVILVMFLPKSKENIVHQQVPRPKEEKER